MSETPRHPELIVGGLLVNPQGQVLVARYSKIAGYYAIPGGHVEYTEKVTQALVREIEEETGLTPTSFRLFQVSERICPPLYKDGRYHLIYLDFLIDEWKGTLQDSDELSEGEWLPPKDTLALPLTYTTRRLIEYYAEVGDDGPVRFMPDDTPAQEQAD